MTRLQWICLSGATTIVLLIAPLVGARWLSPLALLESPTEELSWTLYLQLRLPRVLLAFVAGGALAISGVAFQAIFRNVLASPFTLGISSGAAVGAALSFFLALPASILGVRSSALFALIGALATTTLLWAIARRRSGGALTILLCGVVLSFVFSAVIMLLQHLGDPGEVFRMTHWMLGTLEVVGFSELCTAVPWVALGLVGLLRDSRVFNLLTFGDEFAHSHGVSVQAAQVRVLLSVSCILGGIVSVCGPIGFVGIVVPFITRSWLGYDHRKVLPASIFIGGNFLVICDSVSRWLLAPTELPVGVCTALLGGPIFLWMLLRRSLPTEARC